MDFVLSVLLTAIAYMAFPLIRLIVNGGRFPKNRAHKIALWNSIILGAGFCIATSAVSESGTVWNCAPAVLYYWINRSILADKDAQDEPASQVQAGKVKKNIATNIPKGIGALILGIISSEILLMLILGDSVEGSTALMLVFLVALPISALYFWLLIRLGKKTGCSNKELKQSYAVINRDIQRQVFPNGEQEYIYLGTILNYLFKNHDVIRLIQIYASVYVFYKMEMGNAAKTYFYAKRKTSSTLSDDECKTLVGLVMFNATADKKNVSDPVAGGDEYTGYLVSYLNTVEGIKANHSLFDTRAESAGTVSNPILVDGVAGVQKYIGGLKIAGVDKISYERTSTLHLTDNQCGVSYAIDEYTLTDSISGNHIGSLWFNIYGTENTLVQPDCLAEQNIATGTTEDQEATFPEAKFSASTTETEIKLFVNAPTGAQVDTLSPINPNCITCRKCGEKISAESKFCQHCGTPIDVQTTTTVERANQNYRPIQTTPHYSPAKRKKSKSTIVVLVAVLVVGLGIGSAALLLANDKDNTSQETNAATNNRPANVYNVAVRTITFSDEFTANYVLEAWKNGKADEQSMIEIMDEFGSEQGGGKLYIVFAGDFVNDIDDWCFSSERKVGDAAVIKNIYGYSVCYISYFNDDNYLGQDSINTPNYEKLGVTYEQYQIATIIADDAESYCEYISELGKTLSKGTYGEELKMEKVTDYVNELPLDYGQRIILYIMHIPSDTTYHSDLVDYLNERDDVTYDEMVFILEELGFAVFEDGTVKW